jgi:hypothetical protein
MIVAHQSPDSSLNSVFILAQYVWKENSNYAVDIFDMTHYVRAGWVPFPTTAAPGLNPPGRFIRWGSNGLAMNFKGDQIYLLSGPFVDAEKKSGTPRYKRTNRAPYYRQLGGCFAATGKCR